MSEFVEEDWKLKAYTVVNLRREKINMLVSLHYVQYINNTDKTNYVICFAMAACRTALHRMRTGPYVRTELWPIDT